LLVVVEDEKLWQGMVDDDIQNLWHLLVVLSDANLVAANNLVPAVGKSAISISNNQ
jgi:predicted GNAT family N-acyltransferase